MLLSAVLGAAVWALLGCGLPDDDEPFAVDVPQGVFPSPQAQTPPESPAASRTTRHRVYFLRSGFLTVIERELAVPVFLDEPLVNLLAGPTPAEVEQGLESAIPAGTEVVNVRIERNNVVSIELNSAFFEVEGAQRIRATAQVVLTASALANDAQGVMFFLDGEPQALPDGSGTIGQVSPGGMPRPLRVTDYGELLEADGSSSGATGR